MSELRWNPLLGTWTMVAANRQNRPNMPRDWCPFCPGEGKKVPSDYRTFIYPNDFPALSGLEGEGVNSNMNRDIYSVEKASGACEVVLYSPDHYASLYDLSDDHMLELVRLWAERVRYYKQFPLVKYVFEFENRGPEVGVTMPHPHGQMYAYPFIPLKVETELLRCRQHYHKTGRNLFDDMIAEELSDGRRVILETSHFLVFLPYFTDYPYGVFIVARDNFIFLDEMRDEVLSELGNLLQSVTGMFDSLFERPFPYMMCFHQGAIHSPEWEGQNRFYRFHIEFYPPLRNADTIKYYASSEMGGWAAANTRLVEDTAIELRQALQKFQTSK